MKFIDIIMYAFIPQKYFLSLQSQLPLEVTVGKHLQNFDTE